MVLQVPETATLAIVIRNLKIETYTRNVAVREPEAGTEAIEGLA